MKLAPFLRPPAAPPDLWLARLNSHPDAQLRLYCFNWSGAGASAFLPLATSVPGGIEVAAVQLPGRGARRRETARTRLAPLAVLTARAIQADLAARPCRFALLGHSYGTLMAYATARRLEACGLWPELAILSGSRIPSALPLALLHQLDDTRLTRQLGRMGGMSPDRLADPRFMSHFLPVVRADLTACETYQPAGAQPLRCAVSSWAGTDDWYAPSGEVARWEQQAGFLYRHREFEGGHFFITADQAATTDALLDDLDWNPSTGGVARLLASA
jgi:surfactin synthase thioesterase subunit